MADNADYASELAQNEIDELVAANRKAAIFQPGHPGQCYDCGERSPRLVSGRCAPCRDGR